ncbi:hypothetical protein YA0721_03615 [Pseudomonas carnis]|uniref:hypothetical protein n=1 Tax=Pseudomonas carnis TaxID=2487355 RepID=UPI0018E5DB97|nr:hypothetical protein [Pseudomonas carnis]MBI6655001.1 hypothetical protein [Pseudomonas carnis]MBI6660137.1 hypothetical protein [Pseudomonas carnis]MBI6687142.1 hypothetical protein [Pseudomonas carnis]
MKIDWSKAPEGATHYYRNSPQPWRDLSGYTWKYFSHGAWCPGPSVSTSAELMLSADLLAKPLPQTWTGEGLPPVGIEIEAMMRRNMLDGYAWHRAKVVHGPLPGSEGEVLVFCLETTSPAWVDEFRPVRTPEQIAAEARQKGIEELGNFLSTNTTTPTPFLWEAAQKIYDAGYRKQVEP